MKKTIKMLGLFFITSAIFLACAQQAPEEKKDTKKDGLFPEGDTTIEDTNFTIDGLADGKWTYKQVAEYSGGNKNGDISVTEFVFEKSGTTKTIKSGYEYQKGTIPAGAPQSEIDAAIALGYSINGNKYEYTKNWGSSDFASQTPRIERFYLYYWNNSYTNIKPKTNAAKTKYYSQRENEYRSTDSSGNTSSGTVTYKEYLSKSE